VTELASGGSALALPRSNSYGGSREYVCCSRAHVWCWRRCLDCGSASGQDRRDRAGNQAVDLPRAARIRRLRADRRHRIRAAEACENGFPAFNADEHYILFRTQRPRESVYSVVGGAQGAFSAGENVMTVALPLDDADVPPQPVSRAAFLGELRALLQFSVN